MKRILFFSICFLINTYIKAQSEITLLNLDNLMQATYLNPAKIPDYKLSIGLPGISSVYGGVTNTGFSFNDIAEKKSELVYAIKDWNDVLSKLKKQNYAFVGASIDIFSIRIKVKHYFWSFNISEKVNVRFSYPKDLATLAIHGNESFIGGKVNLKNVGLDATHQRDYVVGVSIPLDRWILGGRLKYIQGLSNASIYAKNLSLATDANYYGLKVTADATLNTAGIPKEASDLSVKDYLINSKNFGLGIDIGASFKINRKIIVSGSIVNVGFIKWQSDATNYNIKGGSEFSGANLGKPLLDQLKTQEDTFDEQGNKLVDSLKNSFQYTESSSKYSIYLIPQLYLTGKYLFTSSTQGVVSVFLEKYKIIRPAITVGIQQQLGKIVNGILTYSIQYGKFENIGLGLVVKPPVIPLQFYLAGDNLFNNYTIINNSSVAPLNAKTFNIRFGINIVLGYISKQDKLNYPMVK